MFSFCLESFSHRIAEGGGRKRPLQKAKSALKALLRDSAGDEEHVESPSSEEEGAGGDDDMTTGADGEDNKKAEATAADLEKEGDIADARQLISKEKARAALEKKTQAKMAASALKEKKQADNGGAKAAGLRKRKSNE